jgi:hypothetical protein
MATVNWNSGVSGSWETGSDWSTGSEPGSGDIVSIGVAGTYTVTVAAAASAMSLSISDASATLVADANLSLSAGLSDEQSLINIAAGTLSVSAGTVTFGTSAAINNVYSGARVDGPGTLSTGASVTTTIVGGPNTYGNPYAQLVLGGAVTWSNSGTVSDSGIIQIGDGSGETAAIINNSGGVFQFLTPYSAIVDNNGASGSFSNASTIVEMTTTNLAVALSNTGAGVIDHSALFLPSRRHAPADRIGRGAAACVGRHPRAGHARDGHSLQPSRPARLKAPPRPATPNLRFL